MVSLLDVMATRSAGSSLASRVGILATAVDQGTVDRIVDRPPNVMWSRDRANASVARAVDGRVCIDNPIRKYDPASPCAGSAQACLWKFIQFDKECSPETYGSVLFQVDRYVWAQGQLATLLASQPGGGINAGGNNPQYASAWVDWCRKVMQLVSLARWATNIRPEYLPDVDEMPEAARVAQMLDTQRRSQPSVLNASDSIALQDQYVRVLFKPSVASKKVIDDYVFNGGAQLALPGNDLAVSLPAQPTDFDPFMTVSGHGSTLGLGAYRAWGTNFSLPPSLVGYTRSYWGRVTSWDMTADGSPAVGPARTNPWPWPASWVPIVQGGGNDTISARMQQWFSATLGMGYWTGVRGAGLIQATCPTRTNGQSPGVVTCVGPGFMAAGPTRCERSDWVRFWWGTAVAQVAMCEAWAKDVVATSFEHTVSAGLQSFIDAYARIPDNLKVLDYDSLTQIKAACSASNLQLASTDFLVAAGVAGAAAGAINPVAGAVVAAVGLLMQGVTELLKALKVLAYGGGDIVAACIPPPVFRMIQTADSHACDFNTADGQMPATVDRVRAVQQAADAGLPVSVWHDAAQAASGETQPGPLLPLTAGQRSSSKAGWWLLGALGVGVGAFVLYKTAK